MNFTPFPILSTSRLVLRKLEPFDVPEILFLRSDEEVNQYVKRPRTNSIAEAEKFVAKITRGIKENKFIYWAIALKGNFSMIGSVCLWNFNEKEAIAEIGYDLHPRFFRKGIMGETLREILKFAFTELKLNKVEAYTQYNNEASIALLNKNRFVLVKDKRDPNNPDNLVFEITNGSIA